jgi:hypothetical protein
LQQIIIDELPGFNFHWRMTIGPFKSNMCRENNTPTTDSHQKFIQAACGVALHSFNTGFASFQ